MKSLDIKNSLSLDINYLTYLEKKILIRSNFYRNLKNFVCKFLYSYQHLDCNFFTDYKKSKKPVIRWIKGDGLDDEITRSAIAEATFLFKNEVDYCLCTVNIGARRVRDILSWSFEPVEWIPINEDHNKDLAILLKKSGCKPYNFGFWWKWFPERIRKNSPEWILDGDMIITKKPAWYEEWRNGSDLLRVSQDDKASPLEKYGEYAFEADNKLSLYSGLISLPPGLAYLNIIKSILKKKPLLPKHNGCINPSEQGVIALAFSMLKANPIPLNEFPFARSYEKKIDFGLRPKLKSVWGYHFSHSFRSRNPHFRKMLMSGALKFKKPSVIEKYNWLRNADQYGIGIKSLSLESAAKICKWIEFNKPKNILEIGTSRGYLSAIIEDFNCSNLTTIDSSDWGAKKNLYGLRLKIHQENIEIFLGRCKKKYDLIIIDLQRIDLNENKKIEFLIKAIMKDKSKIFIYNSDNLFKLSNKNFSLISN